MKSRKGIKMPENTVKYEVHRIIKAQYGHAEHTRLVNSFDTLSEAKKFIKDARNPELDLRPCRVIREWL